MSDAGGGSSVTLDRLFRLGQEIQAEQREQRTELSNVRGELSELRTELNEVRVELSDLRGELRDVRSLLLTQVDHGRRAERRVSELRDDLELMFKAEMMGRRRNFDVGIERRLGDLETRVGALEAAQRPA